MTYHSWLISTQRAVVLLFLRPSACSLREEYFQALESEMLFFLYPEYIKSSPLRLVFLFAMKVWHKVHHIINAVSVLDLILYLMPVKFVMLET